MARRNDDIEPTLPESAAAAPIARSSPGEDLAAPGVPRVGETVAGKYRIDRVIGMGGMGVVVAVTHVQLGESYAMKLLLPSTMTDEETLARFRREAQAAVRIKSEHIARVSDFGELPSGAPYILMELLAGRDLGDLLEATGALPITNAVDYVLQACVGIAEAHALGIVHRDLKPANLFLTQRFDGRPLVKVLDFGISKALSTDVAATPSLTQTSSVFGSPAYMSPEQLRSSKNVDFRCDIWGLGVILYELLTTHLPFRAETASGLLAAIAADAPDPLRVHRPDAPPELEAVVMRCLEKDVRKRVQSVAELAAALAPFGGADRFASGGRPVRSAPRPSFPAPEGAAPSRSSGPAALGIATERPVTAAGASSRGTSRLVAFFAIGAALALVGSGGVFVALRGGASAAAAAPASPPTSSAEAPAALAPPPSPELPAAAPPSTGASPEPARPAAASASPPPLARAAHARAPSPRAAAKPAGADPGSAVAPATPGTAPPTPKAPAGIATSSKD